LNCLSNFEVAESVTPGIVTCVKGVVTRSRDRLIGVRYRLRRTNRYTSDQGVKTPPRRITSLTPLDWSKIVLTVASEKESTGDESYSQ
jgi:hypothetical protein